MGLLGGMTGKIFAFAWLVFLGLLIKGIQERNKVKIIVSAIIVAIPFVVLGLLFYYIWRTGI